MYISLLFSLLSLNYIVNTNCFLFKNHKKIDLIKDKLDQLQNTNTNTNINIESQILDNNFFNYWHCIGIKDKIDFSKPYKINIGELPLVVWKNKQTNQYISMINICKHMGSKLDNGEITKNGCLKCKYHGLENSYNDRFGETIEHEGKLFWSYNPITKTPENIPFFNNAKFVKSFLEIDMECSLKDSAFNTMDLRHPEYVHSGLFGFGNSVPPKNIKHYKYSKNKIGLSFDYESKLNIQSLNSNAKFTNNYHMYVYPTFSWSKVTFDKKNHLIIAVNLLPLENKKTRWYVTICNNYFTSNIQQDFLKILASSILSQDFVQMRNQSEETKLKELLMFSHVFENEEVILLLQDMFKNYEYPNADVCVKVYKDFLKG